LSNGERSFEEQQDGINPDFTADGSEQGGDDARLARVWAYLALGEAFGRATAESLYGISEDGESCLH
jgi:hypothetical protein